MKKVKVLSIVLMISVIATMFAACGNPIESIKFAEEEAKVRLENTYQIEYTITPADIENPKIKWESSNAKVATVDEKGLVTAVAEGEADITATAKKDVSATCKITVGPKFCDETKEVKIEGLYVDDSYKDKDNSNNKLLYMVYTMKEPETNTSVDSKGTVMVVDEKNEYTSERISTNADASAFCRNLYFSDYLENVNVGQTLKVMETFLIPDVELEPGKTITFKSSEFEATEAEIIMDTDSIKTFKNGKELAKVADPDGYKAETKARSKASDDRVKKVKKQMNDYYWTFYVNYSSYKLEFSAPNKFQVTSSIGGARHTANGTYSVKQGYVYLNYGKPSDPAVRIPYELKDGKLNLNVTGGFDVMG